MKNKTYGRTRILGMVLFTILIAATFNAAQTETPTALVIDYDETIVPSGLEPGDIEPLYIVITNTGGLPAREVSANIPTTDDISTKVPSGGGINSGGRWFLGAINPGASARIATYIKVYDDARVGTHYLTLYLTYDESRYDSSGDLKIEEETSNWIIPVEVTSGSLLELVDYFSDRDELNAGDDVTVRLTFENTGESDALDISAYLGMPLDGSVENTAINAELYSVFSVIGITKKRIGDIPAGGTGVVEGVFHVDEDVESKAYTIPLTTEYKDNSGTEHTDVFYIGFKVVGDRKLTITGFETDPAEIHSDDEDVEFTGNVENQGTEQIKNVKVTFQPTYPLKNARSYIQTKEVGTIKGSGSMSFTFYADVEEDIEPQQTNITFALDYEVNSQPAHDEITYTLDILKHPRFEISVDASSTQPSQKGLAQITVSNVGSKCEGVTLIVLEKRDQPFEFDDKSAYLGDIGGGETGIASIAYRVEDNAAAQPHIVPIEIRCTKDDDVLIYSKTMTLEVSQGIGGSNLMTIGIGLAVVVAGYYLFRRRQKSKGEKPKPAAPKMTGPDKK